MEKVSYRYTKGSSIVFGIGDEFVMSDDEFTILYKFFVNKPIRVASSNKSIDFVDYGWPNNNIVKNNLLKQLKNNTTYDSWYCTNGTESFKRSIYSLNLTKDKISGERCVNERITILASKRPVLIAFLNVMRNVFAHSNYWLCLENGAKLIVFEDHFNNRVTARGVIEWNTLFNIIKIIKREV